MGAMTMNPSRRELLGGAAALLTASQLSQSLFGKPGSDGALKLGVASYSFRKLSRAEAIKATQALNVKYINIKDFHLALNIDSGRDCPGEEGVYRRRSHHSGRGQCELRQR